MSGPAGERPLLPLTVRTTRYHCPSCGRGHSKKPAAVAHMGRCWKDPDNRACKTCDHYVPPEYEPETGIYADEYCGSDGDISAGLVANCPYWEPDHYTAVAVARSKEQQT